MAGVLFQDAVWLVEERAERMVEDLMRITLLWEAEGMADWEVPAMGG